jgi:hypothetical protein
MLQSKYISLLLFISLMGCLPDVKDPSETLTKEEIRAKKVVNSMSGTWSITGYFINDILS